MSSTPTLGAVLAAFITASSAAAVEPAPRVFLRHDRNLARAVELGARHPATVRVDGDGSGTLIAPRWVLTAAHVADIVSPFGHRVFVGGAAYEVDDVVLHPRGRSTRPGMPPEVDLALLHLAAPVVGVEPVPLAREEAAPGDAVVVVGYGDYGLAGGDPSPPDLRARGATNEVHDVEGHHVILRLDRDATELEGVGAPGDSGGPLLRARDGGHELLAVSSGGDGPMGQYGMLDIYVSTVAHGPWIREQQRLVDAGEPRPGAWRLTDAVPDSALGRLATGFLDALDDAESLAAFAAEHRTARARRGEADADWVAALLPLGSVLDGPPVRFAERPGRAMALCSLGGGEAWVQLSFEVDEAGALHGLGLTDGRPPRPATPVDAEASGEH